jgi:hypothetical protein
MECDVEGRTGRSRTFVREETSGRWLADGRRVDFGQRGVYQSQLVSNVMSSASCRRQPFRFGVIAVRIGRRAIGQASRTSMALTLVRTAATVVSHRRYSYSAGEILTISCEAPFQGTAASTTALDGPLSFLRQLGSRQQFSIRWIAQSTLPLPSKAGRPPMC